MGANRRLTYCKVRVFKGGIQHQIDLLQYLLQKIVYMPDLSLDDFFAWETSSVSLLRSSLSSLILESFSPPASFSDFFDDASPSGAIVPSFGFLEPLALGVDSSSAWVSTSLAELIALSFFPLSLPLTTFFASTPA